MNALPKMIGVFTLVLFGTLASSSAMAQHRGHGGGSGHGGAYSHNGGYSHGGGHARGGGVRFGISLGLPLFAPAYYPAPYYAYPAYAYAPYPYAAPAYAYPQAMTGYSAPRVYAEQGEYAEQGAPQAAPAPSPAQGDWYYCAASRAYYPDVGECAAGWQRVPAQPPSR